MDLDNQINTLGIENGVGEIGGLSSRTQREALVQEDYTNAWRAGAAFALSKVAEFAKSKQEFAGPYDDVRALDDLQIWLGDMIRSVHTMATDGSSNA